MIEIGRDSISGQVCLDKACIARFFKSGITLTTLTVKLFGGETLVFTYSNRECLDAEYHRLKLLMKVDQ